MKKLLIGTLAILSLNLFANELIHETCKVSKIYAPNDVLTMDEVKAVLESKGYEIDSNSSTAIINEAQTYSNTPLFRDSQINDGLGISFWADDNVGKITKKEAYISLRTKSETSDPYPIIFEDSVIDKSKMLSESAELRAVKEALNILPNCTKK